MKRLSTVAFAVALFAAALAPMNAQAEATYTNSQWDQMQQQVTIALSSDVQSIQMSAMQHIAFFAANFEDQVDFRRNAAALMKVYTDHQDERMRVLALQALNAIGGYQVMERLADHVAGESSARVRKLTNAVLAGHYGVA